MLLPILFSLIVLLSLAIAYPNANRSSIRWVIASCPFIILILLLFPFPISDTLLFQWKPESIFPDPILFRTAPLSKAFSVYLCILWMLSEVIGSIQKINTTSSRIFALFFLGAGILCFFAANALSIILSWIFLDVLTFFLFLFLENQPSPAQHHASPFLSTSFALFSLNLFSNLLIAIPALIGPQATQLDWASVWNNPPSVFGLFCFLIGVWIRLFLFPLLVSSSRFSSGHIQLDIFLRLLYPATVLSLLSVAWPATYVMQSSNPVTSFFLFITFGVLVFSSIRSVFSRIDSVALDMFPLSVAGIAIIVSAATPQTSFIFQGAAAILLIGGGVLYLFPFSGRSPIISYGILVPIVLCLCGLPHTPGQFTGIYIFSGLQESTFFSVILLLICIVFISVSLIRTATRTHAISTQVPRPVFLFLSFFCFLALAFLEYPSFFSDSTDFLLWLSPLFLLAISFLVARMYARFPRLVFEVNLPNSFPQIGHSRTSFLTQLQGIILYIEQIFTGEGALLWTFSMMLLLWIVLKGE
jgi:hypothetical protein